MPREVACVTPMMMEMGWAVTSCGQGGKLSSGCHGQPRSGVPKEHALGTSRGTLLLTVQDKVLKVYRWTIAHCVRCVQALSSLEGTVSGHALIISQSWGYIPHHSLAPQYSVRWRISSRAFEDRPVQTNCRVQDRNPVHHPHCQRRNRHRHYKLCRGSKLLRGILSSQRLPV
jgi:hypothetical protein